MSKELGISSWGPRASLSTREQMLNGWEWHNFQYSQMMADYLEVHPEDIFEPEMLLLFSTLRYRLLYDKNGIQFLEKLLEEDLGTTQWVGPHVYSSSENISQQTELLQKGVNCQIFIHLFYEEVMGVSLDRNMRSMELFQDETLFRTVDENTEDFEQGDIFFFAMSENYDPRSLHVAVYGGADAIQMPWLFHIVSLRKKEERQAVEYWPLNRLLQGSRYTNLVGVRRLKKEA